MRFPEISRKFLSRQQVRALLVGSIDLDTRQLTNILTLYLKISPVKGMLFNLYNDKLQFK